jgi:hypothetical protein
VNRVPGDRDMTLLRRSRGLDLLFISYPLNQNANYDSRSVAGGDTGGKAHLDGGLSHDGLGVTSKWIQKIARR